MAICLHRLVHRISIINPILNQSRQLITSSFACPDQRLFKITRRNEPVFKASLLHLSNPIFAQNTAFLSTTSINLNNADPSGGANEEQLSVIYESLSEDLPHLFVSALDYSKCHKDIVFENRIRGKTYVGIVNYVKQLSFLRLYGHFKYAYVKLDVLKMTQHTEDSSIKVRWRISGITGYRILFKMLQFRVWRPREMIERHQTAWIDGFSTFYVNSDGLIVRHIADKVMPDEDKQADTIEKVVDKLGQVPKLALFVKLSTDIAPSVV